MTSTPVLWYLSRGTGVVALLGLTVSVVLGTLTAGRAVSPRWPRFVVQGLHRNVSLMTVVAVLLHVVVIVTDGYVAIGWVDALVPFHGTYRTFWVGLGALTLDLLLALVVTSLLRHRIGHRAWRAVHWLAYACWPVAMAHGLGIGTDSVTTWLRVLAGLCAAAVVGAVGWRATRPAQAAPDAPLPIPVVLPRLPAAVPNSSPAWERTS